jgi:anion-transporting  ArsA/GET3 family ATPase
MTIFGDYPLTIVVGAGGVGKTTIAAAMGLCSAAAGSDTLVMTFDPSLRLKDTLGVGDRARDAEAIVDAGTAGQLAASLLDARRTFDRLIDRYAPDQEAAERILTNRFYDHLCGTLSGVLEYMAVERLFEVSVAETYTRVVLDTPPTRQALDFLEAPQRLVGFLDSGALRIALKPWFDDDGHLRHASRFGFIGRNVESLLDRLVGLELLRDMAEFFQSFAPLYDGFRERALEVQELLRSDRTQFVLVSGPGPERVADTLFFARRLKEAGHHLGPIIVNRVHPPVPGSEHEVDLQAAAADGRQLLAWMSRYDHRGVDELRSLLGDSQPSVHLPLLPEEPTDLPSLERLGWLLDTVT